MQTINGILYAAMLRLGAANLSIHRTIVNDLNVFPIPDGDTGDNMLMTISSGCDAVSGTEENIETVSSAAAYGMLLGARGNSGVILSRIFSGIAKRLTGCRQVDVRMFGEALESGVYEAYGAVPVPVEGTILTVFKDAVSYANSRVKEDTSFEEFFDHLTQELKASLERTPDLLDVLKQAGVVDSGGAGIVYIADGMKKALYPEVTEQNGKTDFNEKPRSVTPDFSKFGSDSELTFGYCTEFLLRLQNRKTEMNRFDVDELIDFLNSVGDSIVCFREGSIVKVHVHTKTPGEVLNHCQLYGEFLTVKIENMTIQHEETTIQNRYESSKSEDSDPVLRVVPHKRYGYVAVASGDGLKELFTSLGTDAVVDGGQSMNPSTEEFIKAFRMTGAEVIFVFPNNGNVILTARQAASIYKDADVRVVPTHDIGQGYCALSMLDDSSDRPDDVEAVLNEAISGVVTGCVSVASRDANQNCVDIKKGQYLGFVGDTVYCAEESPEKALEKLADSLNAGSYDVMLLLSGCDASEESAQKSASDFEKRFPRTETILMSGGQPVYHYLVILQ